MNDERKRILKLVEEGQLSADEAIMLLEALESKKSDTEQQGQETPSKDFHQAGDEEEGKKKTYKQSSTMGKFGDFIESALQKIKEFDLDFNFGPPVEVNHIFQHRDVLMEEIDVDIANGEMKFIPWDEQDVRVECRAKVYGEKGQEEARKTFLKNVHFSIDGGKMRFTVQKKQLKVNTVFYIPRSEYDEVRLRMFNGPITGEHMNVRSFKAKTANGNIAISDFVSKELEMETANGHITAENSKASKCEAETLNGTVKLDGTFEKMDVNSFNGNVILHAKGEYPSTIFVKTTTGNVDVYVPGGSEVKGYLKSNFGGFQCELPDMKIEEEKKDVVQKSLHFIANEGKERKFHIEAESTTGSILIKDE